MSRRDSATVEADKKEHPLSSVIFAYFQLMRPANLFTAAADILAGFAVAVTVSPETIEIIENGRGWFYIPFAENLLLLIFSSICLYAGGVTLNDFFDADLDAQERPERPIPSGKVPRKAALVMGIALLGCGVTAASSVSFVSGVMALFVALCAVLYDAAGKHKNFFGPINMGLCRGGNLLLGMSAVAGALAQMWFIAIIPVVYVAAITIVSRGEVHGGKAKFLDLALILYILVFVSLIALKIFPGYSLRFALPYLVLFGWMIFRPLRRAKATLKPKHIGKAVKYAVLAIICLNAVIAAGFAGWDFAFIIICLLPLSLITGKFFAVT